MLDLKTKADLQRLVDEKLPESLTLDYKASPALSKDDKKREELCKDVSALANSAGGQIVYGIEEKNQKPTRVDEGAAPEITREWIEQVLNSRIQPRIQGLVITPIEVKPARYAYVITVPQATALAPHQAPDGKYYRRFNFQSVPMADYEIRDMMRRSVDPDLVLRSGFHNRDDAQPLSWGDNGSDKLLVFYELINRSRSPAKHAVIDMYFDRRLKVSYRSTYSIVTGHVVEPHGQVLLYQQDFPRGDGMPIFNERNLIIEEVQVQIPVDQYKLGATEFFMGYRILSPGCAREVHGKLSIKDNLARWLLPIE
jgi:hypothetical protein